VLVSTDPRRFVGAFGAAMAAEVQNSAKKLAVTRHRSLWERKRETMVGMILEKGGETNRTIPATSMP
jgi:hypothetical protein